MRFKENFECAQIFLIRRRKISHILDRIEIKRLPFEARPVGDYLPWALCYFLTVCKLNQWSDKIVRIEHFGFT